MPVDPTALAVLAAQTVVAAASTDVWGAAKRGVARLLGRGDRQREQLAAQRLDQTRELLRAASGGELGLVRARQEAAWQLRLADLLEEHPEVAGELLLVVDQIRAELKAVGVVAAADHAVAAGRDVNIEAPGGVAAGVIHGNVSPPGPTGPGPARG